MTDLIERLRRRSRKARESLAHAEANADDWFSTMPPEIAQSWRDEARDADEAADALTASAAREERMREALSRLLTRLDDEADLMAVIDLMPEWNAARSALADTKEGK